MNAPEGAKQQSGEQYQRRERQDIAPVSAVSRWLACGPASSFGSGVPVPNHQPRTLERSTPVSERMTVVTRGDSCIMAHPAEGTSRRASRSPSCGEFLPLSSGDTRPFLPCDPAHQAVPSRVLCGGFTDAPEPSRSSPGIPECVAPSVIAHEDRFGLAGVQQRLCLPEAEHEGSGGERVRRHRGRRDDGHTRDAFRRASGARVKQVVLPQPERTLVTA